MPNNLRDETLTRNVPEGRRQGDKPWGPHGGQAQAQAETVYCMISDSVRSERSIDVIRPEGPGGAKAVPVAPVSGGDVAAFNYYGTPSRDSCRLLEKPAWGILEMARHAHPWYCAQVPRCSLTRRHMGKDAGGAGEGSGAERAALRSSSQGASWIPDFVRSPDCYAGYFVGD